jgi:hypothetical protein
MTWGLVAVGAVAVTGLTTAAISADAARSSSNTAADAALNATKASTDTQLQMFEQGRVDTAPWRRAGEEALNTLVSKVNAGPGEYTKSPGYAFRVSEGQKAIERGAAARGNLLGGATQKALTRFGQDYATGDYQNFLANYYASLTPYQSLAGIGQTTAQQNAVTGAQVGQSIGNTTATGLTTAGNALASGQINQANAITGGLNSGVNNYLMWKYLNQSQQPVIPVDNAAINYGGGNYIGYGE